MSKDSANMANEVLQSLLEGRDAEGCVTVLTKDLRAILEEVKRLREALVQIIECSGSSQLQYKIATDALKAGGRDE